VAHVSIIGTGNMAQVVADLVTKGGSTVELISHKEPDKPITGDIVVLAIPYATVDDVLTRRSESLAGKIVVDITNPIDFQTFDALLVPADSSATALIAAQLPRSRVIKAFNTIIDEHLAAGTIGALPVTVLIAGDDADAKFQLAEVVKAGGIQALDAGLLSRARELEALALLHISLIIAGKASAGFALV
jgi:hypothetical protein